MIQNILFPVDFSLSCIGIAAYVKRAAAIFGSRVTLFHVYDLQSHNGFELYLRPPQEIAEEHWNIWRRRLDSFLNSEFPLTECPRILRSGEPAEQIAELARTGGFDLIIMPTHAGRFRRMLLGSTTAKVLNGVDCAVMTTKYAEIMTPRPSEHRQWLCAVDLNGSSQRVLEVASRAAAAASARLSLVHVLQNPGSAAQHDSDQEEEVRHRIEELQRSAGCEATIHVLRGPVKDALLEVGKESEADVLIIGRPHPQIAWRLGHLTYDVIRDSPFPVLSV
ncbi:MAG: universal stress protein [Acidobacteriaceae bacterium]|nr:universal stress protein [Acidobacteriaceae bacterium]